MTWRAGYAALILVAACLAAAPARGERLVASLSNHRVLITSNFTGDELIVFGTIERDAATVPRRSGYDIVATVLGPRQPMVTFRKERVFGIWVNRESRILVDAPGYLAVLASRPFDAIAPLDVRRRNQIGLDNIVLPQRLAPESPDVVRSDPFRNAFVRLKAEHGLYVEEPNAVTFLTPALYRAAIPLPAEVPVGTYEVDLKLFADGVLIARASSAFEVVKVGFEQFVATAAREHGVLYGMATAMMALLTGWLASVVFRRD